SCILSVSPFQTLSRLSCAYKTENQTRVVVCDLGNPMKGGIKVLAGLRFSVHQLSEQDTLVKFDLQIQSSNQFNSTSSLVSSITTLAVLANVDFRGYVVFAITEQKLSRLSTEMSSN
ncbi:unnamed protein product, partial [Oncorhynchus mykiss]